MAFTVNFMKQNSSISALVKQQYADVKAAEKEGREQLEKLFPKTTSSHHVPSLTVQVEINGKCYQVTGTPIYKTRNVKGGQDFYEYAGMRCEVKAIGTNTLNTDGPTIEQKTSPEGKNRGLNYWLKENGN